MSEAAVISRPVNDAHSSMGWVLIIDDEAAIRESLETLLEMEGYDVESADSGDRIVEPRLWHLAHGAATGLQCDLAGSPAGPAGDAQREPASRNSVSWNL